MQEVPWYFGCTCEPCSHFLERNSFISRFYAYSHPCGVPINVALSVCMYTLSNWKMDKLNMFTFDVAEYYNKLLRYFNFEQL
jgi:hypothetical protein